MSNTDQNIAAEQARVARELLLAPDTWRERLRQRPSWFTTRLDDVLREQASLGGECKVQLPAFPWTKQIGVFSDYGGIHKESPVETYTFFIADFGSLGAFRDQMAEIRKRYGLGSREISFKELRSGAVANAVPSIMRAADMVHGLLFTLVVDKAIPTILGDDDSPAAMRVQLLESGFASWSKAKETEGFARKLHSVSYWLAMLGRDGMDVLWMTDNDNIVANAVAQQELPRAVAGGLHAFQAPTRSLVGTAKQFPKGDEQPYLNDAIAVADLMAGAIAAHFTCVERPDFHGDRGLTIAEILTLHSHQGVFLKKLTFVVRRGATGLEEVGLLTVNKTKCSKEGYFAHALG